MTFKIEITHRYSHLDKADQIGLVFYAPDGYETYIRWVWFHLGRLMKNKYSICRKPINLYPFSLHEGRLIKTYKFCNGGEKQATLIYNAIKKQLTKSPPSISRRGRVTSKN